MAAVGSGDGPTALTLLMRQPVVTTLLPTAEALDAAIECTSMNDYLWVVRHDWTTLPLVMSVFALLYTVIIAAGVVGNLCVILAIGRQRSLQTVPNMFIFALSCSDVVVSCTSATITPITAFKKEWLFGQFLCSFAPFIAGVSLCVSTFTLAAISIDRFILIRFPTKRPFTHAQAAVVIGLICLLSAGLSMPSMFMQSLRPIGSYCGRFCFEDWGANMSQRRAYGTLMLTLQFILPLVVIIACYTAISMRLGKSLVLRTKKEQRRRRGQVEYEWQAEMNDQQRAAIRRRQRTNRMFIAMVVAFSASWIWNIGFNLLRDYDIWPAFVKRQEFFFDVTYSHLRKELGGAALKLVKALKKAGVKYCDWRDKREEHDKRRSGKRASDFPSPTKSDVEYPRHIELKREEQEQEQEQELEAKLREVEELEAKLRANRKEQSELKRRSAQARVTRKRKRPEETDEL